MFLLSAAFAVFFVPPLIAETGSQADGGFPALAQKAEEARNSDRLPQAILLYKKALAIRPAWTEGWWSLGTLLYDQDDYAGAASALRRAVALDAKAGVAFAMLGLCEAKLGHADEALKDLQLGKELGVGDNPGLARTMLYTTGTLQLAAGDFGKAQDALDRLARDGADEEELILALGMSVLGVRPQAMASADPAMREVVRRAGQAERLAARREFQAASREYASLAADYPKTGNVQFAYGRFLLANHEDDKAVEAFRREIANTPNHLLARLGIAGILQQTDPAAGLPYAEQAVKLAPDLPEAHYLLGVLLLGTGATERAIQELEIAQRGQPDDAKVYFALAKAYGSVNRTEAAARARATFQRLQKQAEEGNATPGKTADSVEQPRE